MEKTFFICGLLITATFFLQAQPNANVINVSEVSRVEKMLASDQLQGRQVFTPHIDAAAAIIAAEFKKAGLQPWQKGDSYLQRFVMVSPKLISITGSIDEQPVEQKNIVVITSQPDLKIDGHSGYEISTVKAGKSLFREALKYYQAGKNYLVIIDTSYENNFPRLAGLNDHIFKSDYSVVFLLASKVPSSFSIEMKQNIVEQKLANVVGVLPGKSKKDEYVIFSAHYDHLGIGEAVNGDSIYNGANDDAAGTTAVILLAKYFRARNDNERTIIFTAFTAEESGGFGSNYFSKQLPPDKVKAMLNIEMIGTRSKWGANSAYITGYEKTDLGKILQKNLQGTGFTFYPDPYPDQQLFYRSDNATLARLGVPAHTISTSKMDNEPNYHKPSDQVETLDIKNMAMIIKSIALSAGTIIGGVDTPTRVNTDELR